MKVEQIYDEHLAHASYVILSEGEMMIVDPARDPQPYYEFADAHEATIKGVIETHPHADFISSHLEIHKETGATIYVSKKVKAVYPHQGFDEGDVIQLGGLKLKAFNTPGHSPDSICFLVEDEQGRQKAVFTGDTLFVGDVGRPDLRENASEQPEKKEEFARQMYRSLREKLLPLDDEVTVYPAHGAGSLCGKGMSDERTSTMKKERKENPGLQPMSEDKFVEWLLEDQLLVPEYFSYAVDLNVKGAPDFNECTAKIQRIEKPDLEKMKNAKIVDVRDEATFKKGHLEGAINIMEDGKFETWLGSIIPPKEHFYLVASSEKQLESAICRSAKIGYEIFISGAVLDQDVPSPVRAKDFDFDHFKANKEDYTIVDIRNKSEAEEDKIFAHAINIPLPELEDRTDEVPKDKPIVVHCASGYRSAVGYSILEAANGKNIEVYDLSEDVKKFKE